MVSYQILKNNEKLQPVVIPPNFDWGHFYGWYIVELDLEKSKAATAAATGTDVDLISEDDLTRFVYKWTDEPVGIDYTRPVEVTQDENVYVAPLYTNYRFLNFHAEEIEDPDDHDHEDSACHIIARKLIVLGGGGQCSIDISDEVYTGPRYTRSSKTGSMLTWTGLFGQTFAQNDYSWSTVNDYSWSGVGADGVKLVLPQGGQVGASYTVSGTIANTSIASSGKSLTVFNSGGADVQAKPGSPTFTVTGDMVHSDEGQTVAFYTEDPPTTKISLKASYYDPDNGWTIENNPADNVGPDATLNFFDLPYGVQSADNSIELFIFDESHKTFSVKETYTNTEKYKFIGWYGKNGATPRDISLDNKEFGDAEVTGLTVTNDPEKVYYARVCRYAK